jgi:hypothetical protein
MLQTGVRRSYVPDLSSHNHALQRTQGILVGLLNATRSVRGTDRRFAAPSEPGQLTEGHQKRPVPSLVLAATAGSDPSRK